MEGLRAGMNSRHTDFFNDTTLRMPTRPTAPDHTTTRASGPSKDSKNPTAKQNLGRRKGHAVVHSGESEDSNDELDSIPRSSSGSREASAGPVTSKPIYSWHADYPAERTAAFKGLKFSKNKSSSNDPASTPKPPPLQVSGRSLAASSSTASLGDNDDSIGANYSRDRPKRTHSITISPESRSSTDASPSRPERDKSHSSAMPQASKPSASSQRIAQPFPGVGDSPQPLKSQQGSKVDKRTTKPSEAKSAAVTKVKRNRRVVQSSSDESDTSQPASDNRKKLKPSAFPMSSPLSSPPAAGPKDFPSLSPLGLNDKSPSRALNTQPSFCPLTAPSDFLKGKPGSKPVKSKAPSKSSGKASTSRVPSRQIPKPFPMSEKMMSDSPPGASKAAKRLSEDSDGGSVRGKKRSKQAEIEVEPFEDDPFEGDSLFISPETDPRTLCPYCDFALPASPTPLLEKLLAETKRKSYSDPRPANPLGRKAPLAVFITVCQRHNFESQILPEAEAKGWPKTIDWSSLKKRVEKMREHLRDLIIDVVDPDTADGSGCRSQCVFWKEVMAEIKKQGTRVATGVKGQFANFDKAQPGYYGELGSVIILQTLGDMFPLSSFDPSLVTPLTPKEFIQRILVPEVGLRLIMQDKRLSGESGREDALQILRESTTYGVAMFPEGGSEWGDNHTGGRSRALNEEEGMSVADQIAMERARKRRKQLEAEGQWENGGDTEVESLAESDTSKASKRKGKGKAVAKQSSKDVVEASAAQPPRGKPRSVVKTASRASPSPSVDPPIEVHSSRPKPRPRHRSVSRAVTPATDEDQAMPSSPTRSKPKPRLRGLAATNSNGPSKRPTRGTSVDVNLCSDDSDASVKSSKSFKVKTPVKPKPKLKASSYCPIDDLLASSPKTPRARAVRSPSLEITSQDNMVEDTPRPLKATSSTTSVAGQVLPLMVARNRIGKNGSQTDVSTTTKPTQSSYTKPTDGTWSFSMSSTINVSDDSDDARPGPSNKPRLKSADSFSWLLRSTDSQ